MDNHAGPPLFPSTNGLLFCFSVYRKDTSEALNKIVDSGKPTWIIWIIFSVQHQYWNDLLPKLKPGFGNEIRWESLASNIMHLRGPPPPFGTICATHWFLNFFSPPAHAPICWGRAQQRRQRDAILAASSSSSTLVISFIRVLSPPFSLETIQVFFLNQAY